MRTLNHTGHYVCECGKEFNKAQSYNAHLSHCRVHLGEEKYLARLNKSKESLYKGSLKAGEKARNNKLDKELKAKIEWESEIHYCERCGKELPHNYEDKYGSGRFCSVTCANTRKHSLETLEKIALNSDINGRCKRSLNGHYRGYYCASSYELIYLIYCLDHNINIERNTFTFKYNINGEDHIYIPDWYLPDTDTIIECKGSGPYCDMDIVNIKAKSVFGHNYKIVFEKDLQEYWNYCKDKFKVKNYLELCSKCYEEKDEYVKPKKPRKKSWNKGKANPAYGRHWYTNGKDNKYTYECPKGYYKGRV